jgi:carbon-monoxide dehydrogenase large subunit
MKRREDRRLLLGAGKYVDDLRPPGCLSVVFVRSPCGHARITRLDIDAVRKAPGVVEVVTGGEVRQLGPMPVNRAIPDMKVTPHPILADGVVHATGVPVAAIVAETVTAGWDAAELKTCRPRCRA